jgi:serine/threonine protein kinase
LPIKPENIFVAASGDLVLGDFGIVFFQDGSGRLTTTYERVGSHYWMAPWAYRSAKVEFAKISPALDIFPLAKVLWSMIAGQNGFPYWEYDRDENNLEKLFPNDPVMPLVNTLLSTRIVRDEGACDTSANALRVHIDALIDRIKASANALRTHADELIDHIKAARGVRPDGASTWPCHVCGKGNYQTMGREAYKVTGTRPSGVVFQTIELIIYLCNHCGHAELFDR